jgi:hypothetical protein
MSWVIIDKATGEALFETYEERTANAINREKYLVIPIAKYLGALNKSIRVL